VDERIIEFVSHALSRRFAIKSLANKLYCTVQYIMKVLYGNPQAPAVQNGLEREVP
jgi:hypothetical protein